MKTIHIYIIASLLLLIGTEAQSQDLHFSQFFNTPIVLNAAQSGAMRQDFRVNAIYRNQWKAANASFSTIAVSADANFAPAFLKGDKIGVGLLFFNDQMGNDRIVNNSAYLSLAYIKTLDKQKRHKLSVGTQFGSVQKKIDYTGLLFGEQINNYQIDPNAATGEQTSGQNFNYFNLNIGAYYRYKMTANTDLHAGISAFNMLKPKENFVQQSVDQQLNKLKYRSVVQLGAIQKLNTKLNLHPEVLIMLQSKAKDMNIGTSLDYSPSGNFDKLVLQAGLWYRTSDALIPYAGLKYHNMHIGLSYDKTVSDFKSIKSYPEVSDKARIGAYEITLTYLGFFKRPQPYEFTIPCRIY